MVLITDAPADVSALHVSFDEVAARPCEGGGWLKIPVAVSTLDLLELTDGKTADLAINLSVPSARYCELRLVLSAATVTVDETSQPLKVPSGASSGLKLKGEFDVAPSVVTQLTVDFDAEKSLHQTGNGKYILKPVIKVIDTSYRAIGGMQLPDGDLAEYGTFTIAPSMATVVPLGNGAEISFPPGSVPTPTTFSFTRWSPKLPDVRSDVVRFSPSFLFAQQPIITLPVLSTSQIPPVLFVNSAAQPTSVNTNLGVAMGPVPHFSDNGLCADFTDVPTTHSYYFPIHRLTCKGVMRGYEATGTFAPSSAMTRAEFLKVAVLLAYFDESLFANTTQPSPFPDVTNHWSRNYVAWAKDRGLVQGDQNGEFRPDDPINRAEAAKILVEAARVYSQLPSPERGKGSPEFPMLAAKSDYFVANSASAEYQDVSDSTAWFYRYVYAVRDFYQTPSIRNLQNAPNNNNFFPAIPLTRRVAAEWVYYALNRYEWLRRRLFCADPNDANCGGTVASIGLSQGHLTYGTANTAVGGYHSGLDFPGSHSVYSPVTGTVASQNDFCGKVTIQEEVDGETVSHVFFHMANIQVEQGDSVTEGQLLGTSSSVADGVNCNANGAHLHYEMRDRATTSGCSTYTCAKDETHNPLEWAWGD